MNQTKRARKIQMEEGNKLYSGSTKSAVRTGTVTGDHKDQKIKKKTGKDQESGVEI
jgi:hypothetical protein